MTHNAAESHDHTCDLKVIRNIYTNDEYKDEPDYDDD